MNVNELNKLLQSNTAFGTADFAKHVVSIIGPVDLLIPVEVAEPMYTYAKEKFDDGVYLNDFYPKFVERGLQFCKTARDRWNGIGECSLYMSAHAMSALRCLCIDLDIASEKIPKWWPNTYLEESAYGQRERSTFWDWTTVPLTMINDKLLGTLAKIAISYEEQLRSERKAAITSTTQSSLLMANIASVKEQKKVVPTQPIPANRPEFARLETEDTDSLPAELRSELEFQGILRKQSEESVRLSMFTARRYLNKVQDANRRGIEFALTLDDFGSLLRQRVCHFTGVALTIEMEQEAIRNKQIPDNYVSLDRLDSKKGYTRDNVVVVAHSVNLAKARMTENEFRQLTAAAAFMNTLSADQRQAVKSLIGMNSNLS